MQLNFVAGGCIPNLWVLNDFNGHDLYYQGSKPCWAKMPNRKGSEDGEEVWIDCPTSNHLVMTSNSKAQLNYGKNKLKDILIVFAVTKPAPQDEIRIYFDNFDKYAYFKFSTVEDGNYTQTGTFFYPDDRAEEGEMGIFDGTQRIGKRCFDVEAFTSGSLFYCLWIRDSEIEGETRLVATAMRGSNAEMNVEDTSPAPVWDSASAYVDISSPIIGFGSGQITPNRTTIASINVQEGERSWELAPYFGAIEFNNLTPDDGCYSYGELGNDYYAQCWGYGYDQICCYDGIAPASITVEVSGFINTQNTDNTLPNYVYPGDGCDTCTNINGTYVLTYNDLCFDAGCSGYQWVYFGTNDCFPFVIGLDLTPTLGVTGNYELSGLIRAGTAPIWYNGGLGTYGGTIVSPDANGKLYCVGASGHSEDSGLIGLSIPLEGAVGYSVGSNSTCIIRGAITITGVSYAS